MSSVGEPRRHRCHENCQTGGREGLTGLHHRQTSVGAGRPGGGGSYRSSGGTVTPAETHSRHRRPRLGLREWKPCCSACFRHDLVLFAGRAQNSVRVLIPNDRAVPWGFHDVILVDMAGATWPSISKNELSTLRRQWPVSLVSGMSKRQTELELMWRDCKARFRNNPTGCCTFCGRNIVHDMARHVSSFHLNLGQLWRCPVSWCTQWKGTPQDCIDHIRAKHHVGDFVKTSSQGKWFPPCTVLRVEWHTVLKSKVSGISTTRRCSASLGPVGSPLPGVW